MNNNLFPIAKEGWSYVAYSFIAFLVLGFLDFEFLQFFSFLTLLLSLYIFRNPERQIPSFEKGGLISPVDGTVTSIQELNDDVYSQKITIESSYFDVSILRAPIESTIKSLNITRGAKLSKLSNLSDKLNEKMELVFEDSNLNTIKVLHKNTLSFNDIKSDAFISKKLIQGSRYGVMTKGITTIYFPKNTKIDVTVGVQLKACESILAHFY